MAVDLESKATLRKIRKNLKKLVNLKSNNFRIVPWEPSCSTPSLKVIDLLNYLGSNLFS